MLQAPLPDPYTTTPLHPYTRCRQLSAICELVFNCLHQKKSEGRSAKGGVARRLAKCLPILINGCEKNV